MRKKSGSHQDHIHHALIEGAPVHPVLKSYFGYCAHKMSVQIRSRFANQLRSHGILPHHYGILIVLHESQAQSQHDLGTQIGIDKASMVKIIDDLEKIGLVERRVSEKDRRINLVAITPKGLKALKFFSRMRVVVENDYLAPLTRTERKVFKDLMVKLISGDESGRSR